MLRTSIFALAAAAALAAPAAAQAKAVPGGNWVWYYQQVQPADAAKFTGARAVVVADQTDDAATVARIHSKGALAFHYVNVYWYPGTRAYEGVDFSQQSSWAFCDSGTQPALGRTLNGEAWYYSDLNERGLYDSVLSYLRSLRSSGYDGVFFDLGTLALGAGTMPDRVSTCTDQPVVPGATFADAFARVVKSARAIGLHVVLNYTTTRPLRPDVAAVVDRTLYENAPDPADTTFAKAFARRRAEEAAAAGGAPRYVEELKTAKPGERAAAFLGWSQAALWRIDLTVNAGDNACPQSPPGSACTRFGTFPELTAVERGRAMDAAPSRRSCLRRTMVRCLFVRRWQYALVLVNMTDAKIRTTVSTGHRRCRIFTDVWRKRVLHRGACTMKLTVAVPPHGGRVFTERYR